MPTLWLDADAAPRDVKEVCYRACDRLALETILALHAVAGDVVITADIPLAAILVPNRIYVIDPRGELYTAESIGERLSVRNFMEGLRGSGVETGGHGT